LHTLFVILTDPFEQRDNRLQCCAVRLLEEMTRPANTDRFNIVEVTIRQNV
jgi:hypothetical protein